MKGIFAILLVVVLFVTTIFGYVMAQGRVTTKMINGL